MLRLGLPTAIIVPTEGLLSQWVDGLAEIGIYAGVFYGKEKRLGAVTVFIINSACTHLQLLKQFPFIIFDEVHHAAADEFSRILSAAKTKPYVLGLSSHIKRSDGEERRILKVAPVIYGMTIAHAIKNSYVSNLKIFSVPAYMTLPEQNLYDTYTEKIRQAYFRLGTINPSELAKMAKNPLALACLAALSRRKILLSNIQDKKRKVLLLSKKTGKERVLVFTESIQASNGIYSYLNKNGESSGIYHSAIDLDQRRAMLKQWKDNQFKNMISVRALDEGIDVPACRIAAIVASGSATRQWIQRCFTAEQLVLTPFPVPIINVGSTVAVARDKAVVTNRFENDYDGDVVKVKTQYFPEFTVTLEHPFKTVRSLYCRFGSHAVCKPNCRDYNRPACLKYHPRWKPQWVDAKDLRRNDFLIIPKINVPSKPVIFDLAKYCLSEPKKQATNKCKYCGSDKFYRHGTYKTRHGYKQLFHCKNCGRRYAPEEAGYFDVTNNKISYSRDSNSHVLNRFIEVTMDLANIFGWYIAEGCPIAGQGIKFNLGPEELHIAIELQKQIREIFNLPSTITTRTDLVNPRSVKPSIVVTCYSAILDRFFVDQFGTNARTKHLPQWSYDLSPPLFRQLFDSYAKGDGHKRKNEVSVKSVSKILIQQFQIGLLLKLHQISGYNTAKPSKNDIPNGQTRHVLSVVSTNSKRRLYEDNNNYYIPIKETKREHYSGKVYNLETTAKIYNTPFTTHNCGRILRKRPEGTSGLLFIIYAVGTIEAAYPKKLVEIINTV